MLALPGSWRSEEVAMKINYVCGFCGNKVGPTRQYTCRNNNGSFGNIYICPTCNRPTFMTGDKITQVPGPIPGEEIEHLPKEIESLYNEARNCISVNAHTSAVLSCRKLLMNISVSKGAQSGKSFAFYVDFLHDQHYIPPNSKEWVDHIRKKGNEATHEIPEISKEDAIELMEFTEMLLRFVYEMPGRMNKYRKE
ncbi:hypothetical protein C2I06_09550 [Niallia circulans]|uniref:DUF4145 domain-containing protein n=1 Tax=Niallia circulans TaxID=1397 RepID=UPI000F45EA03|nr:DUF4145 domain-containing protein [Niallia circulans]AYV67100.1 hypothetical protein C2I06_09550 [Niallia circulans]